MFLVPTLAYLALCAFTARDPELGLNFAFRGGCKPFSALPFLSVADFSARALLRKARA